MNSVKRVLISISIALVTIIAISNVTSAYTPPYTLTESSLNHTLGNTESPTSTPNSGCRGGYCRYLVQSSNPSFWGWPTTANNINQWYAYDPSIGVAAAQYWVQNNQSELWPTVMDQSNTSNKGNFVYIGYSDHTQNTGAYMDLSNKCIAGWGCYGLNVYWDDMGYTLN